MALTRLHKLATTTPAIRREFQTSKLSVAKLAKKYGVSPTTVQKWRHREDVYDRSHARHNLLSSISTLHEEVIVELRTRLRLGISDITEVVNRCCKTSYSSSAAHRCLQRNGVSKLPKQTPQRSHQHFDVEAEPGFVHLDVKYLTKLKGKRSYVYVGIDRATRYVYVEVHDDLKPATAAAFVEQLRRHLEDLHVRLRVVLSDNGFEWTDRCAGKRKAKGSGKHAVGRLCAKWSIEHRLTRVRRAQTNGMVERFNRRISEALAQQEKIKEDSERSCFSTHEQRNKFMYRFASNYNKTRRQCLKQLSPTQVLLNHTGQYTYAEADVLDQPVGFLFSAGHESSMFPALCSGSKSRKSALAMRSTGTA